MSRMVRTDLIVPSPWADLFEHPEEHIARLVDDIRERGIQTPLQVFPVGERFELLAGHDRLEAARRAGKKEVPVEIRSTLTTEDDRFSHFLKDNTLRKGYDARAIARVAIKRWPEASNRAIGARCGVSHPTVGEVRAEMEEVGEVETVSTRVGRDGVAQPARKPSTHRTTESKPASNTDALRSARERAAADVDPMPPALASPDQTPVTEPGDGDGAGSGGSLHRDVRSEVAAVEREVRSSDWNILTTYIAQSSEPPKMADWQIDAVVREPDFDAAFIDAIARRADFWVRLNNAIHRIKERRNVAIA